MAVFKALEPEDPRQVGRYHIVARLGAGGMGQVYLARSPGGRPVAVKVVRPELAGDGEFRRRFIREVAAARLVNGAFTAGVVDADADDSPAWLATVYVPGVSLGEAVAGHGPWPARPLLALAAGLAEALEAIHAAGVVHRDLKPSNILLSADGPRVIDFGISVASGASALTQTGMTIGTAGFMSPEQLVDRPVGPASDVFALGAVLAYTATGVGPFGTGNPHVLHYRTVHEPPHLDPLPSEVREVVAACLAKDPDRRPTVARLLDWFTPADGSDRGGETAATLPSGPDWMPDPIARLVQAHTATALPRNPLPRPTASKPEVGTPTPTPSPVTPRLSAPTRKAEPPTGPPPTPTPTPRLPHAPARTGPQHRPVPPAPRQPAPTRWDRPAGPVSYTPPPHGQPPSPRHQTSRRRVLLGLAGTAVTAGAGLTGWKIATGLTEGYGPQLSTEPSKSPSASYEPSPSGPGSQLWKFRTGDTVTSPVVVGDVVYAGSWDGNLYAVNATTGKQRWSFTADGDENAYSSVVAAHAVVYVGNENGKLYAVDAATGKQRWSFTTGDYVGSSPTVADGVVYVGSEDHHLYAVDAATGKQRWSFTTGGDVESTPAVAGGVVYIGSWDGKLYALDAATGKQRWSFTTGDTVQSSPTVADGMVYVGSRDHHLHAVDAATGKQRWSFTTGGDVDASPAVADGVVYVHSCDHHLYAVDIATRRKRWSFTTGGDESRAFSSPVVAGGVVYVGSDDQNLYAVDAATGRKRWSFPTADHVYSDPTLSAGVVYVGSLDGYLYAVRT
ncbi:PQQ-binding-like beta-propeller repeat protein [Streptomyces sp. NPDC002574]|uniref:outer membrane protein assembly factor BamB family protein n=1 Tax=Streptomyces sp. NPDC002574 TaxID=3364652 RepID=UPI0036B07F75